jgi:hypothetical protein
MQGFHRFAAFTSSDLQVCRFGTDRLTTKRGANTVTATRPKNVKMLAAVIGGSAVVAAGALTMAINQEHASSATLTSRA